MYSREKEKKEQQKERKKSCYIQADQKLTSRERKRQKEQQKARKILLHPSGSETDLSGDSAAVCRHIVGEDGVCFIHLPHKVFDVDVSVLYQTRQSHDHLVVVGNHIGTGHCRFL